MTSDPIADMLTRMRNAIQARHPKVDVPASKLKAEIARILKEEGYITNFKVAEEGAKRTIKIYLKYSAGNAPVISRDRARFAARLPGVRRADRYSARAGRPGNQHPDHAARRDDRAGRAQGARGRRSPLPGLVGGSRIMSRIGKKPIPLPKGVKVQIGEQLEVKGPRAS